MIWDALKRWPLLVIGIILIGWGTKLSSSDGRALLFGSGSIVLGAGLAVIIMNYANDKDEK